MLNWSKTVLILKKITPNSLKFKRYCLPLHPLNRAYVPKIGRAND